ncbi:MAG: MFS transporter [Thermodesulfobacteriota bacterium]
MNRRVFFALFFSVFTTITGVGLVVPLLPVWASQMGASGFAVGLIFGSFSISRTLGLPYFGKASDRRGRKPYIVAGLFGYAFISLLFLFANDVWTLIAIRFLHGFASAAVLPVAQAYVGEITPFGKEARTMGLFNVAMYLSLSVGPLLGGVVNEHFGLHTAFLLMGVLTFAAFLLALISLPPTSTEPRTARLAEQVPYRELLRKKGVLALCLFRFVYTVCVGVIWGFMPVLASREFGMGSTAIGVCITMGVFTAGVLQTPLGYAADRSDKRVFVVLGGLFMAGSVYYYNRVSGFWGLFAANAAFGVGGGISMPALMGLGVEQGKREKAMGAIMALITLFHSLGMFVGAQLAGLVMDVWSLPAAFPVAAAIMAAGTLAFWALCPGEAKA